MTEGQERVGADVRELSTGSKMNLLTNFEGVFKTICELEFEGREGRFTQSLRMDLQEALEDVQECSEEDNEYIIYDFYGALGVHRYGVTNKGEVKFSAFHGGDNAIVKAGELGLRTY
ncbi:MAG: hypothetical protein ABIH67_01330 [Candidatus Uhrbacteria bacterium]